MLNGDKKIQQDANQRDVVVRIKDGHQLWGYTREDLITEKEWLDKKKVLTKKRA